MVSRQELEAQRGRRVPDLVGPTTRLLFVGVNPGLWTAYAQAHFAHPGNRFYPALFAAGITSRRIDASEGMDEDDRRHLLERGVGITNLVDEATARADELSDRQLRAGAHRLRRRVRSLAPAVVAVVGITAYRSGFGRRQAGRGRQDERLEGAELWVLPNPSGLNAHETVASLAAAYREAAEAAGVTLDPPRDPSGG